MENLFFSWRVSRDVSYLSRVTAERAAGRGTCARVWGSRKEQLLSTSSPCVQHFPGSPSSSQEHGAAPPGRPRGGGNANGRKEKFGLGVLPGAVCAVCRVSPRPPRATARMGQSRVRGDAVGPGSESGARRGGCGGTAGGERSSTGGMRWDRGMRAKRGEEMQQPRNRRMERGVRRGDAAAGGREWSAVAAAAAVGKPMAKSPGRALPPPATGGDGEGERGRGTEGSGDVKMQHHPPAPANSVCVCVCV